MSSYRIKYVLILSLFLIVQMARAEHNPVRWTANWIWQQADGPENTWMCFRKTFTLDQIPETIIAHIAVDSKYWLTINDSLVLFEGGLNRGPTPNSGYFDKVDIQPFLSAGDNTIAILVWYWGNEGRNNIDSGKGGLLFQSEMGDFVLKSDQTWKTKVHPAYGHVPFQLNAGNRYYLYGGWNIGFDARSDMPGWTRQDYDDSLWFNAVEKGIPPCEPWNELVERPIPLWKNSGLVDYANVGSFPHISDGSTLIAQLPYNAQVTPYLKINAPAGFKIKIETDHYDIGGYYGQRTEYITREGVQEFESLAWQNGENVIYDIPAGIEILDLKYRETGYATEFAGSFECDDEFYNILAEKAKRTLYVCMRDNYMDCPDRERGQWIGDVATQILQTFYLLDRRSDVLTLKCVDEFVNWRDGHLLKGLAPGSDLTEYASQSLNAISDIGIMMTYYQHTGDLTPMIKSYPAIRDYLNVWSLNDDGLINPRATWNGQGQNVDHILIENTWYVMALKSAIQMAKLMDNWGDINFFQSRLDTIQNNFDSFFWQGNAYRSGSFVDDRANGLVVLSGLAGPEKYEAINAVLRRYKYSGPYMEGYIIEALCQMGQVDAALARIKDRFGTMVRATDTSTLWEAFWRIGSSNHAWSGAPVTSLFKYVVGVAPEKPGYATYHVLPQLGALKFVRAVVPSIKGDIHINIKKKDPQHFIIDLDSPDATTAIVGIPKNIFENEPVNAIEVNGESVWRRGYFIGDNTMAKWSGEDDQFYKFKVSTGVYRFVALRAPLVVNDEKQSEKTLSAYGFPNPFNSQIKIEINMPLPGFVTVKIYDVRGRDVCTLLDENVKAGISNIVWDGRNDVGQLVASGVYMVRVTSGNMTLSEKILLIR